MMVSKYISNQGGTHQSGESGSSTTDICVSPGDNGKRDTLKGNDDVYSGENILVGANLKCDSTANQTDVSPNTSLITAGGLQTYLNETIFNQCVADTFTVESNGSVECNYDLNLDGMLHYFQTGGSSEAQKIIDGAKDLNYNYNVFVVNKIDSGMTGFSKKYQRYAFVDTWGTTATALKSVIAHELGHAFGGLSDITISGQDDENLMSYYRDYTEGFRLRVLQWYLIQVFYNPP